MPFLPPVHLSKPTAILELEDLQTVQKLRWKRRVLLLISRSAESPAFKAQVKELARHAPGLQERDLHIFRVHHTHLQQHWQATPFSLVLIGKDGSVKLRQAQFLKAAKLFKMIDVMPMRRREIRERKREHHKPFQN